MDANHQILCLNMIVKNEVAVIARCLASVRPIIGHWVIVDTGSTDGTQDAVRTLMADLPGELHERPWRDFAHNRNEALELARPNGEYVLWIDADDVLEFEPNFEMPALRADSYNFRIAASVTYVRPHIVRAALPWRWRGVLHEFLTCDDARSSGLLEGLRLRRIYGEGVRQRDPQTFSRDADILYSALQTESDPFMQARYQFYLAQSYRDCGKREEALQAYLKRAELGFWIEEVFISLYRAAQLQEALGRPFDEVMATYVRAIDAVPSRLEALHGASRYCRLSKRYKEGYEIAKRARLSGEVPDGLFVEPWIYEYGLLDELAVNAYWADVHQDSLDACERILRERNCPEAQRPRIEANAAFARQKLGIGNVAVSAATVSKHREIIDESKLKYWLKGKDQQNFGDYLSEFLLDRLFFPIGLNGQAIHLIGSVIHADYIQPMSAGSVSRADLARADKIIFWGCGLRGTDGLTPEQQQRSRILSVRGPLSASELRLDATVPQGDPALLLPALYSPQPSEQFRGKAVCIPHFHDKRSDAELLAISGCDRILRPNIAPSLRDVQSFIDAVIAADFVLSAALHGAIVAAAYSRPFAFWDNGRIDVPFKWADFAASVSIPAEFQARLEEARAHYDVNIRPRLSLPSLLPSVANAPFLPRPEAILKALRRELSELSAEEMLAVIDSRIVDFELKRSHFDTLVNDFESRLSAGKPHQEAETAAETAHKTAYAKRAEIGGDEGGFERQALTAFNMRPQRAAPLYELARFYRERKMYDASVLFSEAGLAIERPEQDSSSKDFICTAGLLEEYSIAANYARDPARKDRGFAACNWLALNRAIPDRNRNLAWSNLFYYVKALGEMLPSFASRRVGLDPPDGYRPLNPSVARLGQQIVVILKTVNYELIEDVHRFQSLGNVIRARNFLLRLSDDLDIQSAAEILRPADMPEPVCPWARGFEDLRLFAWRDKLWGSACLREMTPEGRSEQVLVRIDEPAPATCRLTDWRMLRPTGAREPEKNWMPQVAGDRLQFIRLCDPTRVVDDRGLTVNETTPVIAAGQFRGSSQLIAFDGGWLALIHEVPFWPSQRPRRFYRHRFVWFDETNMLRRVSRPFFFHKKGVEFAAGLAWHTDGERLLISYGVADREAWIATASAGEVRSALEEAEHLLSGKV